MPDPLLPLPRRPSLRAYQARVLRGLLRAIASGPAAPLTVMMPRQSGKNEIAAALVAFLLRTHAVAGGTVVVCAPTLDPQARISAERIRAALAATDALVPPAGRSRSRGDAIAVGRARAVLLSASPQANVAGHTASIALIADEAQDIDEAWFNRQFRPMAASTGAPTILFGTAWNGRTLLERAAEANRARDAATLLGPRRHHQAGWREVAAVLPAYGAYVEAERERLGASHPLFLSQYELVPGEVAGRLLTRGLLAAIEGGHDPLPGRSRASATSPGWTSAGKARTRTRRSSPSLASRRPGPAACLAAPWSRNESGAASRTLASSTTFVPSIAPGGSPASPPTRPGWAPRL